MPLASPWSLLEGRKDARVFISPAPHRVAGLPTGCLCPSTAEDSPSVCGPLPLITSLPPGSDNHSLRLLLQPGPGVIMALRTVTSPGE